MKYLFSQLERKLKNEDHGLVVVPLPWEIIDRFSSSRSTFLVNYYGKVKDPKHTVVVNSIVTPNLLRSMGRVILWEPSEDYMKKMKLSFKITRIPLREISPRAVSTERVEILLELSRRFGYPVVPANVKEGEMLSERGVEIINNITRVDSTKVILSRPLRAPAYVILRSQLLHQGHLVDVTSTTGTNEEWERVRMAEVGLLGSPSLEEIKGFNVNVFPERIRVKLAQESEWKEVLVSPRAGIVDVKLARGGIYFGNRRVFQVFRDFEKVSVKGANKTFTFDEDDVNTIVRIGFGKDTEPFPTLGKECQKVIGDRYRCSRIAAESSILLLSMPKENHTEVYSEVSRLINRDLIYTLMREGEKRLETKYLGKTISINISREGKSYLILRGECEGGRSLRTRIRLRSVVETMVKVRKVVTEWIRINFHIHE